MEPITVLSDSQIAGFSLSSKINLLIQAGIVARQSNDSGRIFFNGYEFYFIEHTKLIKK